MTKLSDLDAILLSGAAKRDTGSLLPAPDSVSGAGLRLSKAIAGLLKRRMCEERETTDKPTAHRADGDVSYGIYITDAGEAAIGIDDAEGGITEHADAAARVLQPDVPRVTKAITVVTLLQREQGATLAELIAATGWLPHTTRAALTGIRKKGHVLDKTKRGDETCYRIAEAVA